jgi:hypothetical protein
MCVTTPSVATLFATFLRVVMLRNIIIQGVVKLSVVKKSVVILIVGEFQHKLKNLEKILSVKMPFFKFDSINK